MGEEWRKALKDATVTDITKAEICEEELLPFIYDSQDLYDYFDPVIYYRDYKDKVVNMDYQKFYEAEVNWENAINDAERALQKAQNDNPQVKSTKEKTLTKKQIQQREFQEKLKEDGVNEDAKLPPAILLPHQEGNDIEQNKADKSPVGIAKAKILGIIATYLGRYTPLYTKHVCTCCGTPKDIDDFYIINGLTNGNRIDIKGNLHSGICKECANKLFFYYYNQVTNKNPELAMQYMCCNLNVFWDADDFYIAKQQFDDGGRKGTLLGAYIEYVNLNKPGKSFMDSTFIVDENYNRRIDTSALATPVKEEIPYDWAEQDARNKKDIIHILGYDPFEYEENEEDKKILYADLVSIIDEDIQQDYVKLQSALTIVKSFTKVRKLDEKAHKLESEGASLKEQKDLADLKAKELKAISDFSRDSGFSERFKTKQSRGENSFSGILKTINEHKFESELINKYDIETSSTIQAAADASFKAIFNQLNLSEAEAYKIAAEQLEELRKVKTENDRLQEELRLSRYKVSELELKEKARQEGVVLDGD